MLKLNYTCNFRSVCCCWLDSWAIVYISESLSFCFNFSKAGCDEWLLQYHVWIYEWLSNLVEFGEVKGKNTLLPLFSCLWEEFRNWKCQIQEKGSYLKRDWYLCSNLEYGLLFESGIIYISLIDIHTWPIVTVKSKNY